MAKRREPDNRRYPRTARLNELLREIIADELERGDDERLDLVTVMSVDVQADLARATVYWSSVRDDDETILEALGEARVSLQRAIGRQARIRKVPELIFVVDPAVRSGERIEEILREIRPGDTPDADPS